MVPAAGVAPNNPPVGLLASAAGVVDAAGVAPNPNRGFGAVDAAVVVDVAGAVAPNRLVGLPAAVVEVVVAAGVVAAGVAPNSKGLGAVLEAAGVAPNSPPGFGASVLAAAGVVVPVAGVVPNPNVGFGAVVPVVPAAGVVEAPKSPPPVAGVDVAPNKLVFAGSEVLVLVVELGLPKENAAGLGAAVLVFVLPNRLVPVVEAPVVAPAAG